MKHGLRKRTGFVLCTASVARRKISFMEPGGVNEEHSAAVAAALFPLWVVVQPKGGAFV